MVDEIDAKRANTLAALSISKEQIDKNVLNLFCLSVSKQCLPELGVKPNRQWSRKKEKKQETYGVVVSMQTV